MSNGSSQQRGRMIFRRLVVTGVVVGATSWTCLLLAPDSLAARTAVAPGTAAPTVDTSTTTTAPPTTELAPPTTAAPVTTTSLPHVVHVTPRPAATPTTISGELGPTNCTGACANGQPIPPNPPVWVIYPDGTCGQTGQAEATADHLQIVQKCQPAVAPPPTGPPTTAANNDPPPPTQQSSAGQPVHAA